MAVVAVVNAKGGSCKTTTVAVVGSLLSQVGLDVLLVDADPQGSLVRWSADAEWTMATVGMPTRTLHQQVPGLARGRDVVVVDTPPLAESAGIVASALRCADLVVVPVAPTPLEVERLDAVAGMLADVGPVRADGAAPPAMVVLSRTIPNAASTAVWRGALKEQGWHVAEAEVRRLEAVAQAAGGPVSAAAGAAFEGITAELMDALNR